jgi:hypothetical protein
MLPLIFRPIPMPYPFLLYGYLLNALLKLGL